MARPKKQTVDYFPHYCNSSKSLFILQSQHGNDGYSFWFKLLQILGKTEGHFFDYNNRDDWLFLITETHVPEEKAEQILETLASIGGIDKELWEKKIIWSQNFVDNVADVYTRRQAGVPVRPGGDPPLSAFQLTHISGDKRTLKELRADTKIEDDLKVADMIKLYEDEIGRTLTPADLERLKDFADTYPDGWFEKAVAEVKNSKETIKSPMKYIDKVMETWKTEGVSSGKQASRAKANRGDTSTTTEKLKEGLKADFR